MVVGWSSLTASVHGDGVGGGISIEAFIDGASQSHIWSTISMTSPRHDTSTDSLSSRFPSLFSNVWGFRYVRTGCFSDGSYWRDT